MADPITGGGGLILLSTTPDIPQIDSVADLERRIATVVGGERDPDVLQNAFDAMRECVDDINVRYFFDFQTEVTVDTAFVEDQIDYDLPNDIYAIRLVQLIKATGDTDDGIVGPIRYVPWEQHAFEERSQRVVGMPSRWSVRDIHNEHEILFYPIPIASAASDYKWRLTYLKRVDQLVRDPTVTVAAPRELGNTLVHYGRYYLLKLFHGEDANRWMHEWNRYRESLQNFKGAQQQTTRGHVRMQVGNMRRPLRRIL